MSDLQKPVAIFFDWDGTLADSFVFLHGAHNHVRKVLGIEPFSLEVFKGYFGQPREKLYAELYGDQVEAAKTHFEAYVRANHLQQLKPLPDAAALLEAIKELGIICGVVSNKKKELLEEEIEGFGWSDYFVSIVGAGEAEKDKPSPAPLILAIERANLSHNPIERIWYVGDTDNDLACANAAGCPAILVDPVAENLDLLDKYDIAFSAKNCAEFRDFVLQYHANSLKE